MNNIQLMLDESQRLNLHFVIGQQRGPVDDIRLCWRIQDKIALSDAEKNAIGYTLTTNNGNTGIFWDTRLVKPAAYDFTGEELARVTKAVKEWQPGYLANDRQWLEPLLAQLEQYEHTTTNDHKNQGVRTP